MRALRFLLSFVLLFQNVVNGPTTINGPTKLATGLASTTVALNTSAQAICATTPCNMSLTMPSGTNAILVQMMWDDITTTFVSLKDCAGSTACGSTTDTFVPAHACATLVSNYTMCSYVICNSTLASGTSAFTIAMSVNPTGHLYTETHILKNANTSTCHDTDGVNQGSGASPSVSTTGNIAGTNELVLGLAKDGAGITPGTGYTLVNFTTNLSATSSNSPPASGAPATATWTGSAGQWFGMVDVMKP